MRDKRPVFNPFYDAVKADDLRQSEVEALFVEQASPVWTAVHERVHQIILGPRGAGKTILLKRLRGIHTSYIGIYVQVSRIANIFRHPFARLASDDESSTSLARYQRAFADYLLLDFIKQASQLYRETLVSAKRATDHSSLDGFLDYVEQPPSFEALMTYIINMQRKIEASIGQWELGEKCTWSPLFDPTASLSRIAEHLTSVFSKLGVAPRDIFLLLDESAPIPAPCQQVVNIFLQRGRSFTTKLAIRPYEWTSLATMGDTQLESGTDFRTLFIAYPDEMTDEYIANARAIVDTLLRLRLIDSDPPPVGWPRLEDITVTDIFPGESAKHARTYFGFRDICALSSSNPQNLLSICSAIFGAACAEGDLGSARFPVVSKLVQHQAMVAWSRDYKESLPDEVVQNFASAAVRRLEEIVDRGVGLTLQVQEEEPSLFENGLLPDALATPLKPAFSLGVLRASGDGSLPWHGVPSRFALSRALLPISEIPLRLPQVPSWTLEASFVETYAREDSGLRSSTTSQNHEGDHLRAFLSTSFSSQHGEDRKILKESLTVEGLLCRDLHDDPGEQFLFTAINSEIGRSDVVVLNATEPRPFTLFEIGLCAGRKKPKPVICVFNDDDGRRSLDTLPRFLFALEVVPYSYAPSRLAEMAKRVHEKAQRLLAGPSEFEKVLLTNVTLRPRRAPKTVYLGHPTTGVWRRAVEVVREELKKAGYRLVTDDDFPTYGANDFQVPIICASRGGLAVIDTSGDDEPDLLQSYKLGVVQARKDWGVLRVEQEGLDHPKGFLGVPMDYSTWNTAEQLATAVVDFVFKREGG